MNRARLEELEKILGYHFENPELLEQAVTHISYANEGLGSAMRGNERLEFLGDAVLELVSSRWLYDHLAVPEGQLSRTRAALVCENSLCQVAMDYQLGQFLRLGKGLEQAGGRTRHAILEDMVESIFGAVYLDGGLEAVTPIIEKWVLSRLRMGEDLRDDKTKLQELVQAGAGGAIEYRLEEESGPPHRRAFRMSVYYNGQKYGSGSGGSKKEAEQKAAAQALKRMRGKKWN